MNVACSSVIRPADKRCGACIQLGWSCSPYCVFATCFPRSRPNKFAIIRRVFGTASIWIWLSLIPPGHQRMYASEYLAWEASYRLRWWARNCLYYIHPAGQGIIIYHNISEPEVRMRLGAATDAIIVSTPYFHNNFPGESSGVNVNGHN